MTKEFKHLHAAHCETGVTTNLLKHQGIHNISEPMAFGLGAGLLYFHVPFLQVSGGPAVTFRTMPGAIFKRTCKALEIEVESKKFKTPREAQIHLDNLLENGIPAGCQVGVYNLNYFAVEYRFHFNAHNMIVFDKKGDKYQISDPTMEHVTELTTEELDAVRFSKGVYAPKGHIYYPVNVTQPSDELFRKAIMKGIKKNVFYMLSVPGNTIGATGMRYTANRIEKWRDKLGPRKAGLYLGQIVRMQEEIGTGGGGFRYLYAAFLEEASEKTGNDKLAIASDMLTKIGDLWRNSAIVMAGIYKGRTSEQKDFKHSAELLREIANKEKEVFQYLAKIKN